MVFSYKYNKAKKKKVLNKIPPLENRPAKRACGVVITKPIV